MYLQLRIARGNVKRLGQLRVLASEPRGRESDDADTRQYRLALSSWPNNVSHFPIDNQWAGGASGTRPVIPTCQRLPSSQGIGGDSHPEDGQRHVSSDEAYATSPLPYYHLHKVGLAATARCAAACVPRIPSGLEAIQVPMPRRRRVNIVRPQRQVSSEERLSL